VRHAFAVLFCSLVCTLAGAAEGESVQVELRLVSDTGPDSSRGHAQVRLDREGEGSIPFANPAGKLIVRFRDGKVFCDANGDGAIDAADGSGVAPPARGRLIATTSTLTVTTRIAGRDEEYPLNVFWAQQGVVLLGSMSHLEGKIGDATVALFDSNLNGSFCDRGVDGIRVTEGGDASTATVPGRELARLGRVAAVGGELFIVEAGPGGMSLVLTPYTGRKATLSVKTTEPIASATLTLARKDGLFTCQATSGKQATLPVGDYFIVRSQLGLTLPRRAAPAPSGIEMLLGGVRSGPPRAMLWTGGGARPTVTMRAGKNELSPGRPFVLDFTAKVSRDRKKIEIRDAALVGALKERYRAQVYAEKVKSALTLHIRARGKEKELSKLEYG